MDNNNIENIIESKEIFDINNIMKPSSMVIIGKAGAGKFTLTKKLMNALNIESITVFHYDITKYSEFNNINIYDTYNSDNLVDIINQQRVDNTTPKLIIFDQCFFSNVRDDVNLQEILVNGKDLNITSIVVLQYPMNITVDFDIKFIFWDDFYGNMVKLYEIYINKVLTFRHFEELMKLLNDYECLVYDKNDIKFY